MFDTIFQRRPHFGEKRVPVKFKLVIKDICFESNEYFMQNSTYSIFQSKNHHHKVKSKKSLFALADTKNIPIDETLKFHATLFEKNAKYSPKTRKIMIRQNTHLNGEDLYKDIGFVELPLDKIAHGSYSKDCKLELVDPERHMKAHINVTIKYKVSKKEDHAADRAEKGNIHATFSGAEWDFENEDEDVGDDVRVLDRNEYSLSGKNAPKNNSSSNNSSNNNISAPRSNSNVNNSNIVVSRNNSGVNVVANRTNSSSNNISAGRNNSGLNNIAVNRANSGLNNVSSYNKSAEPTGSTLQKQPLGRQLNNTSSSNAATQLSTTTSSSPARQLVRVQSTADGVTVSPNTRGSGNNGRGYNAQSAVADQTVTPQHTSHAHQQLSSQHQHATSLHNVSYVKHHNQHPQVPQLPLQQQEQQQYQPQQHRRGSNSPQTSPRLENQQQQYAQQSPRLQYNPRGAGHQSAAAPSQQLTQSSLSSLNYSNNSQVAAPRNGSFSNNGHISQQEKASSAVESLISLKKSNSSISLRSNSVKSVRFEDDPVMPSQGSSSRGKAARMSEEDFFGVTYNEMEGFCAERF